MRFMMLVIPEGYGAGVVMLWDRGTWTPEVDDVDAALARGDLKFTLDGYKLKGSWVLVRTRGGYGRDRRSQDDGRSWLLIKHRDRWSGPLDIGAFAPLSVKSEHDFAGILAEDDPDIWRSARPAQSGDTGRLFTRIVEQALAMKQEAASRGPAPRARKPSRAKTAKKATRKATARAATRTAKKR